MTKRLAVVFSGAGLSAESGIPTFRDSNGLGENHKVEDVASPEGWTKNPKLVLDFYAARFNAVEQSQPNAGHLALAALEEKYNVINITQNIDNLLERAGCSNIIHLHGSLYERKCSKHSSCSSLDGDINFQCDYLEKQTVPVSSGDICPKCSAPLRPNVVWFGEAVNFPADDCREMVKEVKYNNGVFITVGTSAQVYPAAYLIPFFSQVKNKFIVDKNPQRVGDYSLLSGSAGEVLPHLVKNLLESYDVN